MPPWARSLVTARPFLTELTVVTAGFALIALVAFGPHLRHGGFYADDWGAALGYKYPGPHGHFGAGGTLDEPGRPLNGYVYYVVYGVFGLHFHRYLALLLVLAVVLSVAVYFLLRTLELPRVPSFLAGAMVLLFPWSDATRLWAITSVANLAALCYVVGLTLALRALRHGGRAGVVRHLPATLLYVLSVMDKEIAAPAILASVLLYLLHAPWKRALGRWAIDAAAVGMTLGLVTLQAGNRSARPLHESLDHAKQIGREAKSILVAATLPFGPARTAGLVILVGIVAAALLAWRVLPRSDSARPALRRWLTTAGAGVLFIGVAYVMYVPADASVGYNPFSPGPSNRINQLPSLGYALAIVSLLMLVGTLVARFAVRAAWRPRAATALAVAGAALIVAFNWAPRLAGHRRAFDASHQQQVHVIDTIHGLFHGAPPSNSTIYVFDLPPYTGPGVSVFGTIRDLEAALRVLDRDPTINANVVQSEQFNCTKTRILPATGNLKPWDIGTLGNSYLVNIKFNELIPLPDENACVKKAGGTPVGGS